MEFSTYNESDLHKTLKTLYCEIYDGKTEVNKDGHIYDIVTKNNNIIEIQTKNISKLLPKILDSIEKGYKIKLVHPVVISKTILLKEESGKIISKRKSPIKGSIYDIFKELTKIYPVLLQSDFSLEIVEINMIEERTKTEDPVQSKNKKRRYKKEWIKTNKKLENIIDTRIFNSAENYINLLPKELPHPFCAKDLATELKNKKDLPVSAAKQSNLIIWVMHHMNLISLIESKGRKKYYEINKEVK